MIHRCDKLSFVEKVRIGMVAHIIDELGEDRFCKSVLSCCEDSCNSFFQFFQVDLRVLTSYSRCTEEFIEGSGNASTGEGGKRDQLHYKALQWSLHHDIFFLVDAMRLWLQHISFELVRAI